MKNLVRLGIGLATLGLAATTAGGVASAALARSTADPAVVVTDKGAVRGAVTDQSRTFEGIPYAAPPTGALRWHAPQPAAAWTGVRDATQPGSACPQLGGMAMTDGSVNEDCLYLNVTTPAHSAGKKLPVMVWIHGGGLAFGSGRVFDGEPLATQGDAVVVTLNYRLGVFGYLDDRALDGGSPDQLSGNYGLADQQAALRWVRRNAAAFGGDPHNVTLFGESAGAMSVCANLASPASAGLFQKAIMMSAPCDSPASGTMAAAPRPRAAAEQQGATLAAQVGCAQSDDAAVAACLYGKSPQDFLALPGAIGAFGLGPVVGGPELPLDPKTAIATGRFNHVPVIVGTNHDEERLMVNAMLQGKPLTSEPLYRALLAGNFCAGQASCATADQVAAEYPASDYGNDYGVALATALTDFEFAQGAVDTDTALASQVPTYAYEFADEQAPWITGAPNAFPMGAYHTSELPYLFAANWTGPRSAAQDQLSTAMIGYWTRFAHTGNPNGTGNPAWPGFHCGGYVQSLAPGATGIGQTDLATEHNYPFWHHLNG